MKNLLEENAKTVIINRIEHLEATSKPQWGQMDVAQMLAHCSLVLKTAMGRINPQRHWLGLLIGWFMKPVYYNDKPFGNSIPADPSSIISDTRYFKPEKKNLSLLIIEFQNAGKKGVTDHPHPFFGKLTPEQWGKGMYKHIDHHLRQFDV